jgi:hypothetical protein
MRKVKLFHFDLSESNAGDVVLFEAVRQTFERFGDGKYFEFVGSRNLRAIVTEAVVEKINREADAVVIGGGGLFLADTNANNNSGWQWNCSLDMLRQIRKPLIIFAVGYNRFPGQADFSDLFSQHLNETLKRSIFFGLRNSGSIARVRDYIFDAPDRNRIALQPCPTTLLSYLVPQRARAEGSDEIALNVAMDRPSLRFTSGRDTAFEQMRVLAQMLSRNARLFVVGHTKSDRRFIRWISERSAEVDIRGYDGAFAIDDMLDFYSRKAVVIGMRGHAQMIPFGLGVPIISVISHNKMRYFLEDAGLSDFGVDIGDDRLVDTIVEVVQYIQQNRSLVMDRIAEAKRSFHDVTIDNLKLIYNRVTGETAEASSFTLQGMSEWRIRSLELQVKQQNLIVDKFRKKAKRLAKPPKGAGQMASSGAGRADMRVRGVFQRLFNPLAK